VVSGCWTLPGKGPIIHWIGSWIGPRTGLDMVVVVKRKYLQNKKKKENSLTCHI